MESCNIFYSWQSDIRQSRNFISDCLKQLPGKLKDIAIIEIDRDTEGIAGSPNIGDAIYQKIEKADIFVADVTIINSQWSGRKTPNPNVMIELGYAIHALGWDRIVLLYHKDYGDVESLPFDINHQRMTAYSLNEEKKAEARNRIITNIAATITILKDKNMLHGGNPKLLSARRDLSKILLEGFRRIHQYVHHRWFGDWEDLSENFIVVTDFHISLAEELKDCLPDDLYFQLTRLLQKLKMTTAGDEDHYGWEFAEEIAREYFEPLYCEFGGEMAPLSTEQIVKKEFIMLYHAVSGDDRMQYGPARVMQNHLVFTDDGTWQEAYDQQGNVLCKGTDSNGLFTGYRCTESYCGEFVLSKREGNGEEKTDPVERDRFGCGIIRKKGIWKEDKLTEGIIYSAIVQEKDGKFFYENDGSGGVLTADNQNISVFISSHSMEELSCYDIAELELKDGRYEVVEDSVKSLTETDIYGCYEALRWEYEADSEE